MRSIEIDDEVYSHIQSLAIAYEDLIPNDTLKRVFGLKAKSKNSSDPIDLNKLFKKFASPSGRGRAKAPKANLLELICTGSIADGEAVSLVDYSGNAIPGYIAHVSSSQLTFEGRQFSMSELARRFLNEHGYQSQSIRGPAHWATANGKTIRDLWDTYLSERSKSEDNCHD